MRTVTISQHDDGTFIIGLVPAVGPEDDGAVPNADDELLTPDLGMGAMSDLAGMQEARSVDEALRIARDLLTAPMPEEV